MAETPTAEAEAAAEAETKGTPADKAGEDRGKDAPQATLLHHSGWSESILVKQALDEKSVRYRERDVWLAPLTREDLEALLPAEGDLRAFLNFRSAEYRDRGMGERTPPRDMVIELMLRDEALLQLPILLRGDEVRVTPFPEDALAFLGLDKKPAAKAAKPAAKAAAKGAAKEAAKPAAKAAPAKKADAKKADAKDAPAAEKAAAEPGAEPGAEPAAEATS